MGVISRRNRRGLWFFYSRHYINALVDSSGADTEGEALLITVRMLPGCNSSVDGREESTGSTPAKTVNKSLAAIVGMYTNRHTHIHSVGFFSPLFVKKKKKTDALFGRCIYVFHLNNPFLSPPHPLPTPPTLLSLRDTDSKDFS